jgi:hypothetical protein
VYLCVGRVYLCVYLCVGWSIGGVSLCVQNVSLCGRDGVSLCGRVCISVWEVYLCVGRCVSLCTCGEGVSSVWEGVYLCLERVCISVWKGVYLCLGGCVSLCREGVSL